MQLNSIEGYLLSDNNQESILEDLCTKNGNYTSTQKDVMFSPVKKSLEPINKFNKVLEQIVNIEQTKSWIKDAIAKIEEENIIKNEEDKFKRTRLIEYQKLQEK